MRTLIQIALLALCLAGPACAQFDYDPALWAPVRESFLPVNNPSGLDGSEMPGDGNIGRADILYWTWNLPGETLARQVAPFTWYTVDVTKHYKTGMPTGVPLTARWVHLCSMNIMTAGGGASANPAFYVLYRAGDGATSKWIDPSKYLYQICGARLPSFITVPIINGKFQLLWHQQPYPSLPWAPNGAGGSTYAQHVFVNGWAR